jgi:hypothetical protein
MSVGLTRLIRSLALLTLIKNLVRHTTQVVQAHAATEVLLDLGTNKQPSEPKHTNMHSGNLHVLLHVLHRSDRWPAPSDR